VRSSLVWLQQLGAEILVSMRRCADRSLARPGYAASARPPARGRLDLNWDLGWYQHIGGCAGSNRTIDFCIDGVPGQPADLLPVPEHPQPEWSDHCSYHRLNIYGTLALVGGAIYSAYIFWRKRVLFHRMIGNILIAAGALAPAMGDHSLRWAYLIGCI